MTIAPPGGAQAPTISLSILCLCSKVLWDNYARLEFLMSNVALASQSSFNGSKQGGSRPSLCWFWTEFLLSATLSESGWRMKRYWPQGTKPRQVGGPLGAVVALQSICLMYLSALQWRENGHYIPIMCAHARAPSIKICTAIIHKIIKRCIK